MKLVLRGFSQDVDLYNPDEAENFLVFEVEGTDQTFRLPVPSTTIEELTGIVHGVGELDEKVEMAPAAPAGEGQEDEPEPEEPDPVPTPRRVQPQQIRRPIPRPPRLASEDHIPSM